jgi:hypothetical protein
LFDCVIGNAGCCAVVGFDTRRELGMAHFNKRALERAAFLALRSCGTWFLRMNAKVLVPVVICGRLPWVRRPISLAAACSHCSPRELLRSLRYSDKPPVSG